MARAGPRLGAGETYDQLGERVVAALRRIAARAPRRSGSSSSATAADPAARAFIEGVSVAEAAPGRAIGNCEVFRVVTEDGTFRAID